MEKLSINTPQNVEIEYELASLGKRFLALAIDLAVMFCYGLLIYFLLYRVLFTLGTEGKYTLAGLSALFFLPVMFYHFILESFWNGQTLGKNLMKIKVVRMDGGRATIYEYFIRWVLNIVDIWMLSGVIGMMSIILSKRSQRLGDMAAGTTVINLQPYISLNQTIYEELATTYQPTFSEYELDHLSDKDMNIIKQSFLEAQKGDHYLVIEHLADKVSEVSGISRAGMSGSKYVELVIKDHYHYHKSDE